MSDNRHADPVLDLLAEHDRLWALKTKETDAEANAINSRVAAWRYAITPDRAKLLRTRLADLVEPAKGS